MPPYPVEVADNESQSYLVVGLLPHLAKERFVGDAVNCTPMAWDCSTIRTSSSRTEVTLACFTIQAMFMRFLITTQTTFHCTVQDQLTLFSLAVPHFPTARPEFAGVSSNELARNDCGRAVAFV